MIVLTAQQNTDFLLFLDKWKAVIPNGHALQPVEIKNNKFILPNNVLADPAFATLKSKLTIDLGTLEIREIDKTELIINELPFI
jgi:hypothetical protein